MRAPSLRLPLPHKQVDSDPSLEVGPGYRCASTSLVDLPPELFTAICGFADCRSVVRCRAVASSPSPNPASKTHTRAFFFFFFFFPNLGMPTTEGRHRCVARDTVPHRTRTRWDDRLSGSFLPWHDQRSTGSSPSFTTCVEDVGLDAVRDGADAGAVLCV